MNELATIRPSPVPALIAAAGERAGSASSSSSPPPFAISTPAAHITAPPINFCVRTPRRDITQLEYRANRLFGREAHITQLLQRTQHSGLTAVTGPPQIGKSWLLMELVRRLDHETNARCLVGFTRSPKGANDPYCKLSAIYISAGSLMPLLGVA